MNNPEKMPSSAWLEMTLRAHGWPLAFQRDELTAQASHRHFTRLSFTDGRSLVCMTSPPLLERNRAFYELSLAFQQAQLPVPGVLAMNFTQGWALLTDVGQESLQQAYGTAQEDVAIAASIDLLPLIADLDSPALTAYSPEVVRFELSVFDEWFCQQWLDVDFPARDQLWPTLIANFAAQPQVGVHLDFHCQNLLFTNGRLGLVDFQDARRGPAYYDLASLVHDCYHEFSAPRRDHWCDYAFEQLNAATGTSRIDEASFRNQLDLTAIQRQLKALGIFVRLQLRDHRSSHLVYVLPLMRRLRDLCTANSAAHDLAGWLDAALPRAAERLEQP